MFELIHALTRLEDPLEAKNFLHDLCTPQEIRSLNERWRVAQLLNTNTLSYREISEKTGASLTTIGRVARFLKDENYGGYRLMLQKLGNNVDEVK